MTEEPTPPPPPPPEPEPEPYIPPTPARAPTPAFAFDWENLVGIKLFSWIAGIALVLAAVFFLKYSVEHGWLSPTIRATLGILTGASLLVICELRVARGYAFTANAMHGAGIAILYATLFAIHALWHLLPAGVVFFMMLVVTAVAVGLSIRRDSIFIALLGLMGGFATPALLSTGENRPVGLFSYLLLLNFGLAWVAYKKRWPILTIGSLAFTVFYQWGWVSKYLTPAQLPLAVGIFLAFAAMAAAALWLNKRDDQPIFERVALAAVALPLAFGIFTAAVPAYGARYNTLFGFLLLVAAGLAIIAVVRKQSWLHVLGGASVLLTFTIWSAVSYLPTAWPAILAWIAAFVALYLVAATRIASPANATAPLLFFMLTALLVLEPRTASPALLFGVFFVLLAAIAFVAIRYAQGLLYFIASFFVIISEAIWSAKYLTPDRLYAALLLYGAFGLLFLGVPAIARRVQRPLTPRAGGAVTAILSLAMLLFLTIDSVAGAALWGLTALLAILLIGTIVEAKFERRPLVAAIAMILTWIVLAAWWEGIDLTVSLIPALFTIAAFGIIVLLGVLWASCGDDPSFSSSSHLSLASYLFLFFIAAQQELVFPPWPLFGVLAILTLAIGVASLYLRRGTLAIGGALAAQLVLLTWSSHTLVPPWANTGLVALLLVAAWAYVWMFLGERILGREDSSLFLNAAIVALFAGHIVAIGVGTSAEPSLFGTLLATHAILIVATLAIAWRDELHLLAVASAAFAIPATLAVRELPPDRLFTFAIVPYALFVTYPLLLGARAKRSLHPYLAAVIASAAFFMFAHNAMVRADLKYMIGVLPVALAIVLVVLLVRLLRTEPPSERTLGRLAMVAGAALAFVTVAIPLQLDKQWITIAWSLEGAALVWLFTRIPHRGLIAWAGALLAIVFVRLVFNTAVLNYHPASERAIFNWYLYTYLVAAASCFAAAYWLPREWKRGMAAASTMGTILLFVLLNIEIADYYSSGATLTFNLFSSSLGQELTYTIGWAIFAVAMLIAGIALHARAARVAALILLLVTILKCFLHDLAALGGLYRVASLLGLAIALVLVGVLLQKFVIAKSAKVALLLLLFVYPVYGAVHRNVTPAAAGPNRLEVDVALLSQATTDLRDLRLFDEQQREVGYILVEPVGGVPRWLDGHLLPIASTKKTSGFELDLGQSENVDRLRFEGVAAPFLKRARVEGSGDREHWTLLADATVFDLPDDRLRLLEVPFNAGTYRYLRVTWDDGSCARIANAGRVSARVHGSGAAPEPLRVAVPFRKRASEPGKSRYRIDLPGPRLPLSAIELRVGNGNVFRKATITEPRLGNGEVLPSTLGSETVKRAERWGAVAEAMAIPIERPTGRQLDLVIDDDNNAPLALTEIVARFAPQPWIYFEAPAATPLTARYGNAKLEAPRYDIEASRQYLETANPPSASWAKVELPSKSDPEPDTAASLQGAVVDRSSFRVVRPIPNAKAGLAVLLMDADVLARSRALADVRIVSDGDRQVPYVIEKRDEPLVLPLTLQSADAERGTSVYRIAMPYRTLPYGTRIVLRTSARVFERAIDLRGAADERRGRSVSPAASATWRAADPELPPPALTFDPPLNGNDALEIVVHEGDNAPLPITSAELLLPSVGLRFHHPGTALSLLYGNTALTPPRYDLALLAPRLFAQSALDLTLAPIAAAKDDDQDPGARKFFWIAIAVVAVALLALLGRLLKPVARASD
ncbi:MAG TPA: DUF2339 domain-containing protein [Thermoanaerobaculia bacterium]|nr:DUF2339 domain-containing protein [Thermoanaerobaculia bacterium]